MRRGFRAEEARRGEEPTRGRDDARRVARWRRAKGALTRKERAAKRAALGGPTLPPRPAPLPWQTSLVTALLTAAEAVKGAIGWIAFHLTPRPARILPLRSPDEFWVVGHRGAPALEVENTFPSFDRALADGANAIETDFCVTQDGRVVVWHDWDPDETVAFARQAGAELEVLCRPVAPPAGDPLRRPVDRLTLAELRAHYGYAQVEREATVPAHIPTLEEFVAWAGLQGERLKGVFVDLKIPPARVALVAPFLAALRAALARERPHATFVVGTPFLAVLQEVRRLAPELDRTFDVEIKPGIPPDEDDRRYSAVRPAVRMGNSHASMGRPRFTLWGWGIYFRALRRDLKDLSIHDEASSAPHPKRLLCWTINRPRELRRLLRIGVHGILTDAPALLRREHAAAWAAQAAESPRK